MTRRAFVCGHPISHSRSPLIHGHWLASHDIDGSYVAVDRAPEAFPGFLAGLAGHGFIGGNVTIPHKQAAFEAVALRDGAAEAVGAVNTVWLENGRLAGSNTDVYGFSANLDAGAPGWRQAGHALVIGAGGAARAVVHALAEAGIGRLTIANRSIDRAEGLCAMAPGRAEATVLSAMGTCVPHADLIVNTSSLGMQGQPPLDIDLSKAAAGTIVTDIVYAPLETPLLRHARACGLATVDGLGMLLHQAVPGFERWFGIRPSVTPALRDLVVADLDRKKPS